MSEFLNINMCRVQERSLFAFWQHGHFSGVCSFTLFSHVHLWMQSYSKALSAVVSALLLEYCTSEMQVPSWGRGFSASRLRQGMEPLVGKAARCASLKLTDVHFFLFQSSSKDRVQALRGGVLPLRAKPDGGALVALQCLHQVWWIGSRKT